MHKARIALVSGSFLVLLAACVGGPGELPDQGKDQARQGGGIVGDPSGSGSGSAGSGSAGRPPAKSDDAPKAQVTIRASDFDQDCKVDSDCVAVFEGPACTACKCPNAAISSKEANKYSRDIAKGAEDCPDQGDVACTPCVSAVVGCNPDTKKCGLGVSSADEG